jgi:hypothetical protein
MEPEIGCEVGVNRGLIVAGDLQFPDSDESADEFVSVSTCIGLSLRRHEHHHCPTDSVRTSADL